MDDSDKEADICRVCRLEAMPQKPLYHPCMCAGSIMYVHQDCLVRWISHTHKELCELCNHEFSFMTTFSPNMTQRLLIKDVIIFIASTLMDKIKFFLRFILITMVWLYIVPLIEWRTYQSLYNGNFEPLTSLPLDIWSFENVSIEISDYLLTIVMAVTYFVGIILTSPHIVIIDWVERDGPNNERLILIRLFSQNREEDDEEIENQNQWNQFNLPIDELIGLNGLLVFLRHVVLIILFNVLAVLMFVFCPYHIGKLAITAMGLQDKVVALYFERSMTTLFGYYLIEIFFFVLHTFATFIGLESFKQFFGHCYILVKVFMLSIVQIFVIPFLSACWMDICSLSMFNISLKERIQCFYLSPNNFMFMHWISGLIYLYGFLSVLKIFQKVARPGILWFLGNVTDYYQFNYIQVPKNKNLLYHSRKFIVLITVYGTIIFILVWLPVQILKFILPSFLPYTAPIEDNYFDEWSMFIRFLIVLLIERRLVQYWVKKGIEIWCNNVSRMLGIKSYLLGDGPPAVPQEAPVIPAFQPYIRPTNFVLRLIVSLIIAILTVIIISLLVIIIPVCCVRLVMPLFPSLLPKTPKPYRQMTVFEIYVTILNLYLWRSLLRIVYPLARQPLLKGWATLMNQLKWFKNSFKAVIAFIILLCIIPQLCNILFQLVIVVPFIVPMHQSPIIWQMQDIVFHLCCIKLLVILIIFGPTCSLQRAIQQAYTDGLVNLNLKLVIRDIAVPMICVLSLLLAVPYIIAYFVVPLFINFQRIIQLMPRIIYPVFMLIVVAIKSIIFLARACKSIYQGILNERYEISRELLNYNRT